MTILGCAHPQYGALAQIGFQILPLAYRIRNTISKQNNTALFRKRSANKYKGQNIVFIIILPLTIPSKFTLLQNRLLRNTKFFSVPQLSTHC